MEPLKKDNQELLKKILYKEQDNVLTSILIEEILKHIKEGSY